MKKTGWGFTWPWDRKHLRELAAHRDAELKQEFARLDSEAKHGVKVPVAATEATVAAGGPSPSDPAAPTMGGPDGMGGESPGMAAPAGNVHDITMPKLGETTTEGTVGSWLKQPGDEVAFDDPLFEVSTDKVDSEISSPYDGVVLEILVPPGETVPVGTPLVRIGAPPLSEPRTPTKPDPRDVVVGESPIFVIGTSGSGTSGTGSHTAIPVNVYRLSDEIIVDFYVPGVDPQEIEVLVEGNALTVKVEHRPKDHAQIEMQIAEHPFGLFSRQLFLGEDVDPISIREATYDAGVLTLRIPAGDNSNAPKTTIDQPETGRITISAARRPGQ